MFKNLTVWTHFELELREPRFDWDCCLLANQLVVIAQGVVSVARARIDFKVFERERFFPSGILVRLI